MKKISLKKQPTYSCPFCKKDVVSSKKTEVYYRNRWIDGCFECFALSINEPTTIGFQEANY